MTTSYHDSVRALEWSDAGLRLLDQRKLPEQIEYDVLTTSAGIADAIASMRVRGAPAIGIAAAYGVALAARQRHAQDPEHWKRHIEEDLRQLAAARPTAVNLFWALERMRATIGEVDRDPFPRLLAAAKRLHDEDIAANRALGELGATLLENGAGVLTHCNTGSLATGGYGTALGVIRSAHQRSPRRVFATETRPWLQGARLTVWELAQDRIPATLIADAAAAYLMRKGLVQWVIVGADRIAANGDTANKIGTYALAVLARHHGARFMVAAPTSTIDWQTQRGQDIDIENRAQSELLMGCFLQAGSVIDAWNPVFDITPAELIDVIVTERGAVFKPDAAGLRRLQEARGR
jgi:methylthioribose-1-phosphate isomerase